MDNLPELTYNKGRAVTKGEIYGKRMYTGGDSFGNDLPATKRDSA
jgi:hypothetical protein